MQAALSALPDVVDIGAAGTAMRFLTAVLAVTPGTRLLTGSTRMKQRPIGVLVDALRDLGAKIEYAETDGFPPLRITGKPFDGGSVTLSADVSSQYVSALLMIGPCLRHGLTVRLSGEVASRPYVEMTMHLMNRFGASAEWTGDGAIRVAPQPYAMPPSFSVESDWSAASYWYEMLALSSDDGARIVLPFLEEDSLQGDSRVADFFLPLGVKTAFENGAAVLTKCAPSQGALQLDFRQQPDLAQTFVVTCAMQHRPFRFCGLQSLRIKETDRIAALCNELAKLGIRLSVEADGVLSWDGVAAEPTSLRIATYDDHRMAMAFAPCAMRFPGLVIENAEVVSKSYPHFWEDLEKI